MVAAANRRAPSGLLNANGHLIAHQLDLMMMMMAHCRLGLGSLFLPGLGGDDSIVGRFLSRLCRRLSSTGFAWLVCCVMSVSARWLHWVMFKLCVCMSELKRSVFLLHHSNLRLGSPLFSLHLN